MHGTNGVGNGDRHDDGAGTHSFAVTAVDGAGNDTTVTSTYNVQAGDANENVVGPQSVDTDPGGLGASPTVPLQTQIDVPAGVSGQITITPSPAGPPPSGFVLFSRQSTITGPAAPGPTSPHVVTFTVDASELGGTPPASVAVFRNGIAVAACTGPTDAAPDPCVASRTALGDGDAEVVVRTTQFSTWTLGRRTFLVSSVDPTSRAQGVTAQTINISGHGFQPAATVKFSGTGVTIASTTVNSPTSITLSVAVGGSAAVGARDVTVTNPGPVTATCSGCFTINAKPTVATASPSSRPQGASHQTVVITGTNFQPGATRDHLGIGSHRALDGVRGSDARVPRRVGRPDRRHRQPQCRGCQSRRGHRDRRERLRRQRASDGHLREPHERASRPDVEHQHPRIGLRHHIRHGRRRGLVRTGHRRQLGHPQLRDQVDRQRHNRFHRDDRRTISFDHEPRRWNGRLHQLSHRDRRSPSRQRVTVVVRPRGHSPAHHGDWQRVRSRCDGEVRTGGSAR